MSVLRIATTTREELITYILAESYKRRLASIYKTFSKRIMKKLIRCLFLIQSYLTFPTNVNKWQILILHIRT